MFGNFERDFAYSSEVTENQSYDKRTAGGTEVKLQRTDSYGEFTENYAEHDSQAESGKTELVDTEELFLFRLFFARGNGKHFCDFLFFVRLHYFRNELNEENNAYNAERICDCVTESDHCNVLSGGFCGFLRRGKRGGGSKRARENARAEAGTYIRQKRKSDSYENAG